MTVRDAQTLLQYQSLPLDAKIAMSERRIRDWYNYFCGDVYVSFSGGKDSTVLAHLVHRLYPDVPLVFSNTGLEYSEIQEFAKKNGAVFVRPRMMFANVISRYGYPIISKEVAESIYYARSIRKFGGGERSKPEERRKTCAVRRLELHGCRMRNQRLSWNEIGTRDQTSGNQRAVCRREQRKDIPETPESVPEREKSSEQGRNFWGNDAGTGVDGKKTASMFNKQKWLPLCQETQFMIGSNCCRIMKKEPLKAYEHKTNRFPYIGSLAEESRLRRQTWIKYGCNAFDSKRKTSNPMSFWTEQDVLNYIKQNDIEIASVYGEILAVDDNGMFYDPIPGIPCTLKCTGCQRTGCIFCGFGFHNEKEGETRFQRLARTHPKQYEYCMNGGQWADNPNYDPAAPKYDGDWLNWNPKKIWVPSKEGLGMRKVFDDCNAIYGKDFYRYE